MLCKHKGTPNLALGTEKPSWSDANSWLVYFVMPRWIKRTRGLGRVFWAEKRVKAQVKGCLVHWGGATHNSVSYGQWGGEEGRIWDEVEKEGGQIMEGPARGIWEVERCSVNKTAGWVWGRRKARCSELLSDIWLGKLGHCDVIYWDSEPRWQKTDLRHVGGVGEVGTCWILGACGQPIGYVPNLSREIWAGNKDLWFISS